MGTAYNFIDHLTFFLWNVCVSRNLSFLLWEAVVKIYPELNDEIVKEVLQNIIYEEDSLNPFIEIREEIRKAFQQNKKPILFYYPVTSFSTNVDFLPLGEQMIAFAKNLKNNREQITQESLIHYHLGIVDWIDSQILKIVSTLSGNSGSFETYRIWNMYQGNLLKNMRFELAVELKNVFYFSGSSVNEKILMLATVFEKYGNLMSTNSSNMRNFLDICAEAGVFPETSAIFNHQFFSFKLETTGKSLMDFHGNAAAALEKITSQMYTNTGLPKIHKALEIHPALVINNSWNFETEALRWQDLKVEAELLKKEMTFYSEEPCEKLENPSLSRKEVFVKITAFVCFFTATIFYCNYYVY